MNVRTPPLDRNRPVGLPDVGFQLPEIEEGEMVEKRPVKKGLKFGGKKVPGKAIGDSDEDAALGHPAGFLERSQRIIEELEGVDEQNKVEFIVFKGKIFGSARFQEGSVSEPLPGFPDHERGCIETVKAVKGWVEQREVIALSASHIQNSFPWLGLKKDGNGLGHQRFHGPTLGGTVPGLVEPGGSGIKDKAHRCNLTVLYLTRI
jgi:hypothetical protein